MSVDQSAPEAQYYTVVKGDNLSKVSKQYYGDPNEYSTIFEANKPMLKRPDLSIQDRCCAYRCCSGVPWFGCGTRLELLRQGFQIQRETVSDAGSPFVDAKVLHARKSPESSPTLNHRARCSDVPRMDAPGAT